MAKQTYYYRLTPAMWTAAQARGYLLESSCPNMAWTPLDSQLKPNHGEKYFAVPGSGFVLASVYLQVQYEPGAEDFAVCGTLIAKSPIYLEDVTVIS